MALPYYDFFESILRPQLPGISPIKPDLIREAMVTYKVNEPQAVAILDALRAKGFVLIQGCVLG
jgi:senataxin